ncbi:MAG: phage major capsid protein [Gammaproteobacteria bacterium PRO9]|nr:phage major capsid protein [Gammaproteobacteria bacterium PRO9]
MDKKLKEWRAQAAIQAAIMGEINDLAKNENRSLTTAEDSVWRSAKSKFEDLEMKINDHQDEVVRKYTRDEATGEMIEVGLPGNQGSHVSDSAEWRDHEGRPVRVLRKNQSMAQALANPHEDREWDGLTLGNFCRAMVTGPRTAVERRALAEGTGSAGGYTVPTPLANAFIDRLRARSVIQRAGAVVVPMQSQTLSMAKLLTDPAAAWHTENASVTASDMTFGQVKLTAQTLISHVKASRELVEDSINLGDILTASLSKSLATELDRVALLGSGTVPEPQGLMTLSGVNEVSMGTNGAALSGFAKLMDLRQALDEANNEPPTAWIMAPRSFRAMFGQSASDGHWINPPNYLWASLDGKPILNPDGSNNPLFLQTTAIPLTQTQGTASNASTIFAGDFSQMMIGMRSELRIEVLRELYAGNHQYGFVAHLRADVQVTHAQSFGRLVGITPA